MSSTYKDHPVSSAGSLSFLDVPMQFFKDSVHLVNRCTKPSRQEFIKVAQAVSLGFLLVGGIGFMVKLIHIPINNILMG